MKTVNTLKINALTSKLFDLLKSTSILRCSRCARTTNLHQERCKERRASRGNALIASVYRCYYSRARLNSAHTSQPPCNYFPREALEKRYETSLVRDSRHSVTGNSLICLLLEFPYRIPCDANGRICMNNRDAQLDRFCNRYENKRVQDNLVMYTYLHNYLRTGNVFTVFGYNKKINT